VHDPSRLDPEDSGPDPSLPRFERFTPSSGNGLTPGCGLAILAFLVIERTAIWASINGWWVAFLMEAGGVALGVVVAKANARFARKVDPFKGAAPGDRAPPMDRHPPESW
jgi:hypothetical protein